ncbi:MAG: hypothetical protein Q7R69_01650 [bacterium]|nr:hypothetical protein [bacterium]
MKTFVTILAALAIVATSSTASAQMMSRTTPGDAVTTKVTADRDIRLKELITATAVLSPWPTRQPPPFEFPDASDQKRLLTRDYKGKVVIAYLFAEW